MHPHRPTNRGGTIAHPLACSLSVRRIFHDIIRYFSGLPHTRRSLALSSTYLPFPARPDQYSFFKLAPAWHVHLVFLRNQFSVVYIADILPIPFLPCPFSRVIIGVGTLLQSLVYTPREMTQCTSRTSVSARCVVRNTHTFDESLLLVAPRSDVSGHGCTHRAIGARRNLLLIKTNLLAI